MIRQKAKTGGKREKGKKGKRGERYGVEGSKFERIKALPLIDIKLRIYPKNLVRAHGSAPLQDFWDRL